VFTGLVPGMNMNLNVMILNGEVMDLLVMYEASMS